MICGYFKPKFYKKWLAFFNVFFLSSVFVVLYVTNLRSFFFMWMQQTFDQVHQDSAQYTEEKEERYG